VIRRPSHIRNHPLGTLPNGPANPGAAKAGRLGRRISLANAMDASILNRYSLIDDET
jgi:hypothetical protein